MRRWQREWLNDDSEYMLIRNTDWSQYDAAWFRRNKDLLLGISYCDPKPTKAEEPQQIVESEFLHVLEGG